MVVVEDKAKLPTRKLDDISVGQVFRGCFRGLSALWLRVASPEQKLVNLPNCVLYHGTAYDEAIIDYEPFPQATLTLK